jgi:hypothetical protein
MAYATVGHLDVAEIRLEFGAEPLRAEIIREHRHVIGVHDESVVDVPPLAQSFECQCAIGGEIVPGLFEDLATKPLGRQIRPNDVLGAIGGPGILDHHVVDQPPNAAQAAFNDGRFILNDHAQADLRHT